MTPPLRLLVTGAGGYVGRHVSARALAGGHEVRASMRDPSRAAEIAGAVGAPVEPVALDLLHDAGWDAAMAGIDAVLHTASPVPIGAPRRDEDVIRPALEGTRRVMTAAARAGVARVVVTSSIAAVLTPRGKDPAELFTAEDWTDAEDPRVRAYARAKTLAEREARRIAAEAGIALATINPGVVFGPPLGGPASSSLALIERLLKGRDPLLPRLLIPCVTARDVAEAHLRALTATDQARILMVADSVALQEVAALVRQAVPGARASRLTAPDWAVRLAALVSPSVRAAASGLGRAERVETATAEALLGRPMADPRPAVGATARALAGLAPDAAADGPA
jgi:dihydroflavonol-4-reductase